MNLFEYATRNRLRFASTKGLLNTEDLWMLPLQSKASFDLDTVAKTVNAELKANTEDSFVATTPNPAKAELQIKLDLVKHIIAVKLAENEQARTAAARKAERDRLLDALAGKKDEELKGLTVDELQARIAALG